MNDCRAERPAMAARANPEKCIRDFLKPAWRTALFCGAFSVVSTASALADFRVCNATQNLVGVAIGYRVKTGWTTEGWWHVNPSACKTLIQGPLSSRFYYLYAEDAERGGRWEGPVNMCVADKEFKIAGINDCFTRGFQRAGFQEYDTGEQSSWMVQLTDEAGAATDSGATPSLQSAPQPVPQPNQPSQNQ